MKANSVKKFIYSNAILYRIVAQFKKLRTSMGGATVENKGYGRFKKDIQGHNNVIRIGESTYLDGITFRIRGNNNLIEFGEGCNVGKNCSFWMEGNNIRISVGSKTSFTHDVQLCAQEDDSSIIVGEDCMFSNKITVRTSDSHPIYAADTGNRINEAKNVRIGNHVWLAPNVKVMKGATIGNGAIIGSDTMVFHEVPEGTLAVGQPAKIVKENVMWTREKLF